jgi:hypothetical protein
MPSPKMKISVPTFNFTQGTSVAQQSVKFKNISSNSLNNIRVEIDTTYIAPWTNSTTLLPAQDSMSIPLSPKTTLTANTYKAYVNIFYSDSLYLTDTIRITVQPNMQPTPNDSIRIRIPQIPYIEYGSTTGQVNVLLDNYFAHASTIDLSITNTTDFSLTTTQATLNGGETGKIVAQLILEPLQPLRNVGHYSTTLRAVRQGGGAVVLRDSIEITFDVVPFNIDNGCSVDTNLSHEWTGYEIEVVPTVTCTLPSGNVRLQSSDMGLSYDNNIDIGNNAVIYIDGRGNYGGHKRSTFKITKKRVSLANLSHIQCSTIYYDGNPHPINVAVKNDDTSKVGKITKIEYFRWSDTIITTCNTPCWVKTDQGGSTAPLAIGKYKVVVHINPGTHYDGTPSEGLEVCNNLNIVTKPPIIIQWDSFIHRPGNSTLLIFDYVKFEEMDIAEGKNWGKVVRVDWIKKLTGQEKDNKERCKLGSNLCWVGSGMYYFMPAVDKYTQDTLATYAVLIYTYKNFAYPIQTEDHQISIKKIGIPGGYPLTLRAYPSIAVRNTAITIEVLDENIGQNIEVYNTMGTLVLKQEIKNTRTDIFINEMPGTYFVIAGSQQTKVVIM